MEEKIDANRYGYQDLIFAKPVKFIGKTENENMLLLVTGKISAEINACCSRCLQEFTYPVSTELCEQYSNKEDFVHSDEENEIHLFHGNEIDITEAVLKQIYLDLPMKFVCQENCRGFCPYCGINLNTGQCSCADDQIDPRWEKLKILLDSNKKEV